MKSYLTKNILISLTLVWFLTISSSLFAINFNESRKVIRSQYSNAVYRDLTVLDTMSLNTKGNRIFLLELGKRPSYYWDSNKRFYLLQDQKIEFRKIFYNDSANDNLYIKDMSVGGTLVTDGVTFNKSSSVTINGNGVLLLDYHGYFTARFLQMPTTVNVSAWTVQNTGESASSSTVLYMRDLLVGSQPFPNPRMFLWSQSGSDVRATGTATTFELKEDTASDIKNYYGPWEVASNSNLPAVSLGTDPCDSIDEYRCYKCTGGTGCTTRVDDNNDNKFTCKGSTNPMQSTYDPNYYHYDTEDQHWCYDYQAVTVGDQNSAPGGANNNTAYYEFKVQEIYAITPPVSGTNLVATLVDQNPKVFNNGTTPFFVMSGANLNVINKNFTNNQLISINGMNYSFKPSSNMETVLFNDSNPCHSRTMCKQKRCTENKVYIRRDYDQRDVYLSGGNQSGAVTNLWPTAEGPKQNLVIRTFTVGLCPKREVDKNYETNQTSNSWEGLQPNSKYYKMCIRRKVRCNMPARWQETSGTAQNDYKFFTTDY